MGAIERTASGAWEMRMLSRGIEGEGWLCVASVDLLRSVRIRPAFFALRTWHKVAQVVDLYGAPRRTRTCNPRVRSPMLYPIEPGARRTGSLSQQIRRSHASLYPDPVMTVAVFPEPPPNARCQKGEFRRLRPCA